jgi:hypothetical protein
MYILHPAIFETYLNGAVIEGLKQQTARSLEANAINLRDGERAVLKFLQARLEEKAA